MESALSLAMLAALTLAILYLTVKIDEVRARLEPILNSTAVRTLSAL